METLTTGMRPCQTVILEKHKTVLKNEGIFISVGGQDILNPAMAVWLCSKEGGKVIPCQEPKTACH